MKRLHRRTIWIGLPAMMFAFPALLAAGCLPIGPIGLLAGGRLQGEEYRGPEPGWSQFAEDRILELEVSPGSPRSVNVGLLVIDERLFVSATLRPDEKRWPRAISQDPRVVVRLRGTLYPRRATRVHDAKLLEALFKAGRAKYDPAYFETDRTWFFELGPRE